MGKLSTPILWVNFNRPDISKQSFARIREAQPHKLYFAVDGPRESRGETEAQKVAAVRAIIDEVDWDCQVKTLFREQNVGCKLGVSGAIDWFFEQEEMGIILEDDCLPDLSFFFYCQELLDRYKDDARVMIISGDNFQNGNKRGDTSYYFTKYPDIWGWATWRSTWQKYDVNMRNYQEFLDKNVIADILPGKPKIQQYWLRNFDLVKSHGLDTWDYQLVYMVLTENGLAAAPNVNLVTNVGFHAEATHTTYEHERANMDTGSLGELIHPKFVISNHEADEYTENYNFITPPPSLERRVKDLIKRSPLWNVVSVARRLKRSLMQK